jgi:hypothetical protein
VNSGNPEGGEHGPATAVGRPWEWTGGTVQAAGGRCSGNQCRRGSLVRDYRMPASPLASDEMTASAAAPRWGRFFVLRNHADKGVQNVAEGKGREMKAERVRN